MGGRVDARDVLDPNATTARAFQGQIIGHYRPTGPNAWDDYQYISRIEETIEVLPGLEVQLEPHGPDIRMRSQGRVIRVRWLPQEAEQAELVDTNPRTLRRYLSENYLSGFASAAGGDAAAVIARKLRE